MAKPVGPNLDAWGRTWLVVTGASRGFGSGICEEFASQMAPKSVILGLARSTDGLNETAKKIKIGKPEIEFIGVSQDLGNCDIIKLQKTLEDSLGSSPDKDCQTAILVHNAGSLGTMDYLRNLDDVDDVRKFFDLNVSSLVPLTTAFLRVVESKKIPNIHIVNISSLCATTPMKSFGLYCTAKAARDMMFRVLADEQHSVSVLNYAPGPLDNEMQEEVRSNVKDPEVKKIFQSMKDEKKLVQVKDSALKLVKVLIQKKYASGDHVDYFDD